MSGLDHGEIHFAIDLHEVRRAEFEADPPPVDGILERWGLPVERANGVEAARLQVDLHGETRPETLERRDIVGG